VQSLVEEPLTLSPEEQTAFNIARWAEMLADPQWEQWEGRIETDEFGNAIMIPLAPVFHGAAMAEIGFLLHRLVERIVTVACPISTAKGVKLADVAWMPNEVWDKVKNEPCLATASPLCVEVLCPSNSRREMVHRKALYFEAGAEEVWFCDPKGQMTFFLSSEDAGSDASRLCPAFPAQVEI
jgi:Uma2 family endonuclease